MKPLPLSLSILVLSALAATASAAVPVPVPGGSAAAIEIAPHRAVYRMSLASTRQSSSIADVRGKMQFEWADACTGWTIEQRFNLDFLYTEGDQMAMRLSYATWEAKDGLSYRFNVRRVVNGELDEEVRGDARLDGPGEGGVVHYVKPKETEMALPRGTLFPSQHTMDLLQRAAAGETLFLRTVFDGSDAEGATEINAVIGGRTETSGTKVQSPLLKGPAWPVRLAFFPLTSHEGPPEYELNLTLLSSGIAEGMRIDYGDFSLNVDMEALEPLPLSTCR